MQEESSDELEAFTRKIRTLNSVASDLREVIEEQNNRVKGIAPHFDGAFGRLKGMIRRVSKSDNKRFRAWIYFLGGSCLVFLLIFVFFIIL